MEALGLFFMLVWYLTILLVADLSLYSLGLVYPSYCAPSCSFGSFFS